MVTFFYSCKEASATEYEKIRAKNMMRNNRRLQSLGIRALVSMVRNSNDVQEGSAITQGSSSDYNPKDDEVIDQDESDDTVVDKQDKVLILSCLEG